MTNRSKFVWVSASPSLKYFHRPLLANLANSIAVEVWEYCQTLDEISSIDRAVELLQTHLSTSIEPVHLIGHGIGGTIALMHARKYPHQVASLTLLSVAVRPGINWHSYYYDRLWSMSAQRDRVLQSVASDIFPPNCDRYIKDLVDRLERDLVESPSSHSLLRSSILPAGGVEMPLLICSSQDDPVITAPAAYGWTNYLKPIDKIWHLSTGGHYFHYVRAELVSCHIKRFWQELEPDITFHQRLKVELN
jgi:pimeloyl-ACP methyl ester carboxylesterase